MSVEALVQVFRDHGEVSPQIQAILIALAWRTPNGRDSTVPTSYSDIARLTRQSRSTVRDNLLRAVGSGAVELVWARPGSPSRYRVNRGEWFVSGTNADDLEAALNVVDPVTSRSGAVQGEVGSRVTSRSGAVQGEVGSRTPFRDLKKEKDLREDDQPSLFEAKNPDLLDRLRERGHIE